MTLVARDRHLWSVDEDGSAQEICQEVRVSRKERDLLSGSTTAWITICHQDGDEEYDVKKKHLSRKMIQELLMDKDISIADDDDTTADVVDYIRDTDKTAPVQYFHNKLGFEMLNSELIYLSSRPIGKMSEAKKASQYANMAELGMKGSFESWKNVIKEEVLGRPNLELALAIGASAPLVYLLRKDGVYAELPVIALIGESSSGKTSCCRLAAAIAGSPTEGSGLVKDLNSTQNAFFRQMAERQGTCFIFDEATNKTDWKIVDVAYPLVKGMEKARCSANGSLNDRASFSGTVLLSGEHSLLADTKLNCGVLARIVEFENFKWTESGEHADRLCHKLVKNHGHAVIPLMEHILAEYNANAETFTELFYQELALLKELQPLTHGIEGRVYNIYATLLVAAKVASKAWQLPLHVDEIRTILLENHAQKKPIETQAQRLYDLVIAKINQNTSAFPESAAVRKMDVASSGRVWGKRETKKGRVIVWITCDMFQRFVEDRFPNAQDFFSELADKELMVRDYHRHYKFKRSLIIGRTPCHGFYLEYFCGDEPDHKNPPKPKKRKISPRIINLLADDDNDASGLLDYTEDELKEPSVDECKIESREVC